MGPCPHMHPRRGCINGLGRAPSPYGHPFGVPIIGRDLFFFWSLVHSPSARSRLQWAPIGCPYAHPSGVHYNGCPKGHPYVHPFGVHIISRDLLTRVCVCARGPNPKGWGHMSQFWPKLMRFSRKFAAPFFLA